MNPGKDFVIGFDLGGTKLQATAVSPSFKPLATTRHKTKITSGGEEVYERIRACIKELLSKAELRGMTLRGLGVGSPGPLNPETGVILDTPNLHWKNFPLGERLSKDFGVPVAIDNDVNMGVYGEYHFGSGKGYRNVIGIFPGTGIGGGLILDGKLFRGTTGNAGELGHIIVKMDGPRCGCGRRGCLEALASRVAIAREAAALALRGHAPYLLKTCGTDLARIRSGSLADAIKAGDKQVEEVVRTAARYIGVVMGSLVNIFSPDAFVLGGGLVQKMGKLYIEETTKAMREHSFPFLASAVKVHAAALADNAVVMGAAKLMLEKLAERPRPRGKRKVRSVKRKT
jgi:glucokinase